MSLTYDEIDSSLNYYINIVKDNDDGIFELESNNFQDFIKKTDELNDINLDTILDDLSNNHYSHDEKICENDDCDLEEYKNNINELNYYDNKIKKDLGDYEKNISRLEDSLNDRQYVLFISWVIIFLLIFISFCFTIIESKTDMNIILRIIVYLFIFYVLYNILYASYSYINEYI